MIEPNDVAIKTADLLVDTVRDLPEKRLHPGIPTSTRLHPVEIVLSARSGVGILYENGRKYAAIDCLNCGEVRVVLSWRNGKVESLGGEVGQEGLIDKIAEKVCQHLATEG